MLRFVGSATLADNVEIVVGDGADLTVVSIDDWADDAVHVGHRHAQVGPRRALQARRRHLRRRAWSATTPPRSTPARAARSRCSASTSPTPASTSSTGCSSTTPRRKTKSHVTYKGALQGQGAHTVWIGNVLIRKVAEGIETYEENRNLVLTDGCQADSVPNLEIETGEIDGAGHASATGRFDDEQLFYLRSRGIAEDEARRLVVHGFFNDLIRRIDVPELEEQLAATVEAELAQQPSWPRSADGLRERLLARRVPRRRGASRPRSATRRSRSPATARSSSRSRTSAPTPRSRSARATSRAARSSAGCTARASTSAPASPPGFPPPSRWRPSPSSYAAPTCTSTYHHPERRHPAMTDRWRAVIEQPLHEAEETSSMSRDQGPARHGQDRRRGQRDPQGRRR